MANTIKPTSRATPKSTTKPKVTPKATSKPSVKPSTKPSPKPSPSKTKFDPIDALIKSGVNKLSPSQKAQIAKMLGIKYDPKITNPDYKGNSKDINPNWKP
jgi:hypothetical protein